MAAAVAEGAIGRETVLLPVTMSLVASSSIPPPP